MGGTIKKEWRCPLCKGKDALILRARPGLTGHLRFFHKLEGEELAEVQKRVKLYRPTRPKAQEYIALRREVGELKEELRRTPRKASAVRAMLEEALEEVEALMLSFLEDLE